MVSWRERTRVVIFEAETPAGRAFDVGLIIAILLSVSAVMLDSVASIRDQHQAFFYGLEWAFTILFTIEYGLRLWCVERPLLYARSFFGVVDLLGVIPTYVSLLVAGSQYLLVIRVLRVLRVFRILHLSNYVGEAGMLMDALVASRRKITVFLVSVLSAVIVFGSFMYLIEGGENGFTSIPRSVYWAIVTLTTVGYGDIAPQTVFGQVVASFIMITGYGVIAVPTGIVTLELNRAHSARASTRSCSSCSAEQHLAEASFCWRCGANLYRGRDTSSDAEH